MLFRSYTVKPGETKKITFTLVPLAVQDLDSKKAAGADGGFTPSKEYAGGNLNIAITRTSNNVTKDKTYGTTFSKTHPSVRRPEMA